MIRATLRSLAALAILIALAACAAAPAAPAPAAPTSAPAPAEAPTAMPMATDEPTAMAMPMATDEPTAMAMPMATDEPTAMDEESFGDAAPFKVRVAQYFLDTAGFHGMATTISDTQTIDTAYLTTVSRVSKVLRQTTWPADLDGQAQAFLADLDAFSAALTAGDVPTAKAASEAVHDSQHELSHAIDGWIGKGLDTLDGPSTFDVRVAQYFLDTAGFHGMATTISDTQTIDTAYLTTVDHVNNILKQTVWPTELNDPAGSFISDLITFRAALTAGDVPTAKETSETAHDAQHELSHAIDNWISKGPAMAAEPNAFDVRVAQYFLDTAGFHGMATTISDTQTIDSAYLTTVTRVAKVLRQTTWPADLDGQAQAFLTDLDAFSAALTAGDVPAAKAASEAVHDSQHELSHAIDGALGGGHSH